MSTNSTCVDCPQDPKRLAEKHGTEDYLVVSGRGHLRMNKFDDLMGRANPAAINFWHGLARADRAQSESSSLTLSGHLPTHAPKM